MEKSIIVIGAGIAGLSGGCYARMNGYPAEVFEAHNLPGGVPSAALCSRDVLQLICHQDGKRFRTTVPLDEGRLT